MEERADVKKEWMRDVKKGRKEERKTIKVKKKNFKNTFSLFVSPKRGLSCSSSAGTQYIVLYMSTQQL